MDEVEAWEPKVNTTGIEPPDHKGWIVVAALALPTNPDVLYQFTNMASSMYNSVVDVVEDYDMKTGAHIRSLAVLMRVPFEQDEGSLSNPMGGEP